MKAKFSILCPSFNHEKYVSFFIQSLLEQSFKDFELIIVDDCSSDKNVEKIKEFKDERIKLIQHSYNQGINASLNTAFHHSNGDLLVFCASDDMLEPNFLELAYKHFKENEELICLYPRLTSIDENNNLIKDTNKITITNRMEILRHIFLKDHCLSSPGLTLKRQAFEKIFPLRHSLCNHQDTFINVSLLTMGEILITDEKLVRYRKNSSHSNISAYGNETKLREKLELDFVLDLYLDIKNLDFIEEIFKDDIKELGMKPFEDTLDFILAMIALNKGDETRRIWAYHKIMSFYKDKSRSDLLYERYNFTFKDFLSLTNLVQKDDLVLIKYKKYKRLFRYSLFLCIFLLIFIIFMVV